MQRPGTLLPIDRTRFTSRPSTSSPRAVVGLKPTNPTVVTRTPPSNGEGEAKFSTTEVSHQACELGQCGSAGTCSSLGLGKVAGLVSELVLLSAGRAGPVAGREERRHPLRPAPPASRPTPRRFRPRLNSSTRSRRSHLHRSDDDPRLGQSSRSSILPRPKYRSVLTPGPNLPAPPETSGPGHLNSPPESGVRVLLRPITRVTRAATISQTWSPLSSRREGRAQVAQVVLVGRSFRPRGRDQDIRFW